MPGLFMQMGGRAGASTGTTKQAASPTIAQQAFGGASTGTDGGKASAGVSALLVPNDAAGISFWIGLTAAALLGFMWWTAPA